MSAFGCPSQQVFGVDTGGEQALYIVAGVVLDMSVCEEGCLVAVLKCCSVLAVA